MFKFVFAFDSIGISRVLEFLFFCLMNRVSYMGIRSALEMGVGYEYYQDLYVINLAVQALCVLSDYFWLIYACVPIYFGYFAFKYFLVWANSTGAKEEEVEDDDSKKKKKQKVKYIKSR